MFEEERRREEEDFFEGEEKSGGRGGPHEGAPRAGRRRDGAGAPTPLALNVRFHALLPSKKFFSFLLYIIYPTGLVKYY